MALTNVVVGAEEAAGPSVSQRAGQTGIYRGWIQLSRTISSAKYVVRPLDVRGQRSEGGKNLSLFRGFSILLIAMKYQFKFP